MLEYVLNEFQLKTSQMVHFILLMEYVPIINYNNK